MANEITNEELAGMIEREFAATRGEMTTKRELGELRGDISVLKEDVAILRRDTEAGFQEIIATLKAVS